MVVGGVGVLEDLEAAAFGQGEALEQSKQQAGAKAKGKAKAKTASKAKAKAKTAPKVKAKAKTEKAEEHGITKAHAAKAKAKAKSQEKTGTESDVEQEAQEGTSTDDHKEVRTKKEQHAAYMRYSRSLEPASQRSSRSDKCPTHILDLIKSDPYKRAHYQALWLSQKSWAHVEVFERKYQLELDTSQFISEWVTEGQLMKIYREKDVVKEIIANKEAKEIRDHPEAPGCKKALQYWCRLAQRHVEEISKGREFGMNSAAALDTEKDKEVIEALNQKLDEPPSGVITRGNKPTKTPEQRKAEAEQRKQEKLERIKNDISYATATWLAGVSKDITKAKERAQEATQLRDEDTSKLYTQKFGRTVAVLESVKLVLEDKSRVAEHRAEISKGTGIIEKLRNDVKAFDKLKPVYLPELDKEPKRSATEKGDEKQ